MALVDTSHDMQATGRIGNWSPDGEAERNRLRRDFRELTPVERVKQVSKLSRFMSRVAEAGHRQRGD